MADPVVTHAEALDALKQAKASLETTALYFLQHTNGQPMFGMLLAVACILHELQDGMEQHRI